MKKLSELTKAELIQLVQVLCEDGAEVQGMPNDEENDITGGEEFASRFHDIDLYK